MSENIPRFSDKLNQIFQRPVLKIEGLFDKSELKHQFLVPDSRALAQAQAGNSAGASVRWSKGSFVCPIYLTSSHHNSGGRMSPQAMASEMAASEILMARHTVAKKSPPKRIQLNDAD